MWPLHKVANTSLYVPIIPYTCRIATHTSMTHPPLKVIDSGAFAPARTYVANVEPLFVTVFMYGRVYTLLLLSNTP